MPYKLTAQAAQDLVSLTEYGIERVRQLDAAEWQPEENEAAG